MGIDTSQNMSASDEEQEQSQYFLETEQSGKRKRAQTEHLQAPASITSKKAKLEIVQGKGTELNEMPRVCDNMSKAKSNANVVKKLYKVLYGVVGTESMRKREIRAFSGGDREQLEKRISKLQGKDLSEILGLLDVAGRTGSVEEKATMLTDFLVKPSVQHKAAPAKKKKAAAPSKTASKSSSKDSKRAAEIRAEIKKLEAELKKIESKPAKAPAAKKARKSKKSKKDDGKIKRAKSAYIFFGVAVRDTIVKENPNAENTDIMGLIGAAWKKVAPKEKTKYEKMAAADKERVEALKAAAADAKGADAKEEETKEEEAAEETKEEEEETKEEEAEEAKEAPAEEAKEAPAEETKEEPAEVAKEAAVEADATTE